MVEEKEFLKELKKLIGKKLLEVKEIQEKTFGYVLKDNHIIGLGLYECELTQLPDSIYNLKFLEVLNLNYNMHSI